MNSVEQLLNDAEVNYLCDLFLAHLGADRSKRAYRYLRNTVILCGHGDYDALDAVYAAAECARKPFPEVFTEMMTLILDLPSPPHVTWNATYASTYVPLESGYLFTEMSDSSMPERLLGFLGVMFMYALTNYYDKYTFEPRKQ